MKTNWSRRPPRDPLCEVCLQPGSHDASQHEQMLHAIALGCELARLENEANKPRRRLP